MRRLRRLSLAACDEITNAGIRHLEGLCEMRRLNLSHAALLTDDGLRSLEGMPQLESLDISFCDDITQAGRRRLREAMPPRAAGPAGVRRPALVITYRYRGQVQLDAGMDLEL